MNQITKYTAFAGVCAVAGVVSFFSQKENRFDLNIEKDIVLTSQTEQDLILHTQIKLFSELLKQSDVLHFERDKTGSKIQIDGVPGIGRLTGHINSVLEYTNYTRIGGDVKSFSIKGVDTSGTFAYSVNTDGIVDGLILLPGLDKAFTLAPTYYKQEFVFKEVDIHTIVCHKHPGTSSDTDDPQSEGTAATSMVSTGTVNTSTVIPKLNSNINASVHLYLNFGGEVVRDVLWDGGKVINALPTQLSVSEIQNVWSLVSQRYSAFNINITTDPLLYNNAKPGSRMKVIITPTNDWKKGFGGYAFISSLRLAGIGVFSPNIPCFVFTSALSNNTKYIGEAVAHELGHTLGLFHDGSKTTTYYSGQGNWAPVMGNSYYKDIVHFSKGEYLNANNKQDDVATITNYVKVSNNITSTITNNNIRANGVICNGTYKCVYNIPITSSGSLTVSVNVPKFSGLNTVLEIFNNNQLIKKSNPINDLNSNLDVLVKPGLYQVVVSGEGEGSALTNGYSSYGNIGAFTLNGTVIPQALK